MSSIAPNPDPLIYGAVIALAVTLLGTPVILQGTLLLTLLLFSFFSPRRP
jgi:hypothetical protein